MARYLRFIKYAVEGLTYVLKAHPSFRLQSVIAIFVLLGALLLGLERFELLLVILLIFSVLSAELLNTAIETTLDYMATEHHHSVKIAKDVAAGGVLLISIGAAIIGLIIFSPYLL